MRCRLKNKQIEWDKLDEILFLEKKELSIAELQEKLVAQPFNLKLNEALLVGRYIIEKDEVSFLDLQLTENVPYIKSALRKLVGQYSLIDEQAIISSINEVIMNLKETLQI